MVVVIAFFNFLFDTGDDVVEFGDLYDDAVVGLIAPAKSSSDSFTGVNTTLKLS